MGDERLGVEYTHTHTHTHTLTRIGQPSTLSEKQTLPTGVCFPQVIIQWQLPLFSFGFAQKLVKIEKSQVSLFERITT